LGIRGVAEESLLRVGKGRRKSRIYVEMK